MAEGTAKKYLPTFKRWQEWATVQGVPFKPADPYHVCSYLVKLIRDSETPSPVVAASCAIAWYHGINGWDNPCCHFQVQNVLQAAKRSLAKPKNRKSLLSKELLQQLANHLLSSDSLKDLQLLTVIAVGFTGLLRWDDLSHIHADEIVLKDKYMAIFLEVRKNDQLRHGHWILISRWQGEMCPVALVEQLLAKGRHSGHQLLFGKVRTK